MVRLKSEATTFQSSDADENLLIFTKMQALGNDFVVVGEDDLNYWYASTGQMPESELARKLCNRHFSIGADGLIIISNRSETCDIRWSYVNSDGSRSVMCGNGLRCLALWCVTKGLIDKKEFTVETGKGPVAITFEGPDRISTELGSPVLSSKEIPVSGPQSRCVVQQPLKLKDRTLTITCIGMGNPHCVVFDNAIDPREYGALAGEIQQHAFFPQSVNVSFVKSINIDQAEVAVWERGCGPTLACASGAAAVLVAGVLEHRLARQSRIKLPGGDLIVHWRESDDNVIITGPAAFSFTGAISAAALEAVP